MKEFDFRTIQHRLIEGWRTPLYFAVAMLMFTLITLHFLSTTYKVQMLVLPAPADQIEGNNANGSATIAISSLLGMGGGPLNNSNYIRYQRLLSSPAVAQRMQDKYGMLQYVFSKSWDANDKKWVEIPTLRHFFLGWLFDLAHVPIWTPPDVTTLADYIRDKVVIVPSTTTDLVAVSMESSKVEFARRVMLAAHEQANDVLRDQVADRARQQVAYLESKLAQTSVADYRATLLALLSSQEKTLMLTQTKASFAAEIVSPPIASQIPVSPRPVLYSVVAIMVGVLVGSILVIFFGPGWWRPVAERIAAMIAARGRSARAPHRA